MTSKPSPLSDSWSTPQDVFDELNKTHGPFELDVCASDDNAKCERYLTDHGEFDKTFGWLSTADGMNGNWHNVAKVVWMNPPYSDPYPWIKKASEEAKKGCKVVCLLKTDHSTAWYKDFIEKNSNEPYPGVTVIKYPKRIKFIPPPGLLDKHGKLMKASAKWPSIIVIFEGHRTCSMCGTTQNVGTSLCVSCKET